MRSINISGGGVKRSPITEDEHGWQPARCAILDDERGTICKTVLLRVLLCGAAAGLDGGRQFLKTVAIEFELKG
jgi:hypothetical protein